MKPLIVTIDGPSGTGKSTVSKRVAERLHIPHLDTGAYYRAATVVALRQGLDPEEGEAVSRAVGSASFDQVGGSMYLDGTDVTHAIRLPEVTARVSEVSAIPAVRVAMVEHQREWVERNGGTAVVEGRDIGSVVFPEAAVKIYLHADPETRARRRAGETGESVAEVLSDQARRDGYDSTRRMSPLMVPPDAVVVDTSAMTIDQVVDRIVELTKSDSPA